MPTISMVELVFKVKPSCHELMRLLTTIPRLNLRLPAATSIRISATNRIYSRIGSALSSVTSAAATARVPNRRNLLSIHQPEHGLSQQQTKSRLIAEFSEQISFCHAI